LCLIKPRVHHTMLHWGSFFLLPDVVVNTSMRFGTPFYEPETGYFRKYITGRDNLILLLFFSVHAAST
jgi:hypothetical protein